MLARAREKKGEFSPPPLLAPAAVIDVAEDVAADKVLIWILIHIKTVKSRNLLVIFEHSCKITKFAGKIRAFL